MATLQEIISKLRTIDLAQPDTNSPHPFVIYDKVQEWAQYLLTQAQNTNVSWSVNSWAFQFAPGQDEILLNAPDFGKSLALWTANSADPDHLPQEVLQVDLQDIADYARNTYQLSPSPNRYGAPATGGYGSQPEKGRWPGGVMAIRRSFNGLPYIRLMPPIESMSNQQALEFVLWYETGAYTNGELEGSPILPQWHPYLRALVANDCLPLCKWGGISPEEHDKQYQKLNAKIQEKLVMLAPQFQEYIQSDRNRGEGEAVGFCDWYEESAW